MLTRTSRREHITPILKSLHWLLVSFCFCIDFKIILPVIKALHGLAPADLSDMFVMYEPGWPLWSSESFSCFKVRDKKLLVQQLFDFMLTAFGTGNLRI